MITKLFGMSRSVIAASWTLADRSMWDEVRSLMSVLCWCFLRCLTSYFRSWYQQAEQNSFTVQARSFEEDAPGPGLWECSDADSAATRHASSAASNRFLTLLWTEIWERGVSVNPPGITCFEQPFKISHQFIHVVFIRFCTLKPILEGVEYYSFPLSQTVPPSLCSADLFSQSAN